MRQPQPQIIDNLWHCLCPSFGISRATSIKPFLHRPLKPRNRPSSCRSIRSRTSAPVTIIPSHPRNPTFYKPKHILSAETISRPWSRREGARKLDQVLDLEGRDLRTTTEIHEALRKSVEDGYFAQIYKNVEVLIHERGEKPDVYHYEALLAAQTSLEYGSAAEVERLLQEMKDNDIEMSAKICSTVLKALAIHPHYLLRQHILQEMERNWYALHAEDHNFVAAAMLKEGQFELAWDYLNTMLNSIHKPEPWLFHIFLYTLSLISAWPELHAVLRILPQDDQHRVSPALWFHLLLSAAREQYQPLVTEIWNKSVRLKYINPSSGLCTTVLESCAVNGDSITAADVFRVLTDRSTPLQIWHYESLMEAYLTAQDIEGAISTIKIMIKAGFPLTVATTRAIFISLRDDSEMLVDALGIMTSGQDDEILLPLTFANAVLEAVIQQNGISSAIETLPTIEGFTKEPVDVSTFNILLQGCSKPGKKDVAMGLASEMKKRGIMPNTLTYDRLILACVAESNRDDLEDAWRYYNEFEAMVASQQNEERNSGIRRGTIKKLGEQAILFQDRRVFDLLDKCNENGMYIDDIRREFGKLWNEAHYFSRDVVEQQSFAEPYIGTTTQQIENRPRL